MYIQKSVLRLIKHSTGNTVSKMLSTKFSLMLIWKNLQKYTTQSMRISCYR